MPPKRVAQAPVPLLRGAVPKPAAPAPKPAAAPVPAPVAVAAPKTKAKPAATALATILPDGPPQAAFVLLPITDTDLVNNVICRELVQPSADGIIRPDPTVKVIDQLVYGIIHGTDLTPIKAEVSRILSSQKDKARIVAALVKNHDFHRVNLLLQVRAIQEQRLHAASQRGDLTVSESLAFLKLAEAALAQTMKSIEEAPGNSGENSGVDATGVALDKVDAHRNVRDKEAEQTYAGTTPHGREIIRRRLHAMKQDIVESGRSKTA